MMKEAYGEIVGERSVNNKLTPHHAEMINGLGCILNFAVNEEKSRVCTFTHA
jgi:hypothetical protein